MKHNCFLILAAAIVVLVCIISNNHHTYSQPRQISIQYTVQSNDTLWTVAERYCPADMDIRQFVSEVLTERNWDLLKTNRSAGYPWKTILPGQILTVEFFVDEP